MIPFFNFLLVIFLSTTQVLARTVSIKNLPFAESVKKLGVNHLSVCGDADILVTKKSLGKDFQVGKEKRGYLFAGLISQKEYFSILRNSSKSQADKFLGKSFAATKLILVDGSNKASILGTPDSVEYPYQGTIKDCMQGVESRRTKRCEKYQRTDNLKWCCSSKFPGPRVHWKTKHGKFTLKYTPDPSLKLKVPGERKNRYCFSTERLKL